MEFGFSVGGPFLSAFLRVTSDRIPSTRNLHYFFRGDFHRPLLPIDEEVLNRLDRTLRKISDVHEDAERKIGYAVGVKAWLGTLNHTIIYCHDLLDELNTELSTLKLDCELQQQQDEEVVVTLENKAVVGRIMGDLKKVTDTLESLANQIHALRLEKFDPEGKYPHREPSNPEVDKSQIFGRGYEKEKIIERVVSDEGDSDLSVIAITGMGGIGKTTLAQLVYNDDRVKAKFKTRAWVCVSAEHDVVMVTKALLMEVNSGVVDDKDDFNHLLTKLKDSLKGKCFLIILDDIWNEDDNDWSLLRTSLNYGSKGSKIIVTTRNQKVARMMHDEHFHHLHPMPEDQSWCLFKSQAFDNGDHIPLHEFEKIGKEIVKRCKGLPLAIKNIAGTLRPHRDINVWQDFFRRDNLAASSGILPALSLSYKHLPSHLKGCFAFCALLRKDVPFDKDEVVLLWMANDLVKPSTLKGGRVYFEELKSRSFFESLNGKEFLMHDLIIDLARFVAGSSCIMLEDYEVADLRLHRSFLRENELSPEVLQFSYLSIHNETFERFRGILYKAQSLRTFLPIHQDQVQSLRTLLPIHQDERQRQLHFEELFYSFILPKLPRLRALNLSFYHISRVSHAMGYVKHLRFLNLASTNIKKLPNAICKCLNLQTLILAYCRELVELPEEMRLLINLQHLDVRGVGDLFIKKMAMWLSICKDIPNISVVVDKIQGIELELLVQLQLCHSLNIIGLEDTDVATIEKAKRAGLIGKDYIEDLTLKWGGVAECLEDELNKFSKLEPHTNIKQLTINGYKGTTFPDWLGDSAFSNMESLSLEDCKNCFSLPPLGQLTGLQKLKISGMDRISEIGKEFYGDASTSKPSHALQELKIYNCNNIMSFSEGVLAAPNLKTLWVAKCRKMKSLPARMHTQLPLLTELRIEDCPEIECFPKGGLPSSLEILHVSNCKKMRICQTNWGLQTLRSLTTILFSGFEDTLFPEEGLLPTSLQKLDITGFRNMESLNEKGLQHLCSLQSLYIKDCRNLKYLPNQKFSSSLSEVNIRNCYLVESFPEGLASTLSQLIIRDCPKLAARIEKEKGEDWPKVSHIPNIEIL